MERSHPIAWSALLYAIAYLPACDSASIGSVGAGGVVANPPVQEPAVQIEGDAAQRSFEQQVAPLLTSHCLPCHSGGDPKAPPFLAPSPAFYTTLKAARTLQGKPLVDLHAIEDSPLLARGQHTGPAWTIDQQEKILTWLALERAAYAGQIAALPRVIPQEGDNTLDLAAWGVPGASLAFAWRGVAVGAQRFVNLSDIRLYGGCLGIKVVRPQLALWSGGMPTFVAKQTPQNTAFEVAAGTFSGSDPDWLYSLTDDQLPAEGLSFVFESFSALLPAAPAGLEGC